MYFSQSPQYSGTFVHEVHASCIVFYIHVHVHVCTPVHVRLGLGRHSSGQYIPMYSPSVRLAYHFLVCVALPVMGAYSQ